MSRARFVLSAIGCQTSVCQEEERAGCQYRIAWAINPHMQVGAARPRIAGQQLAHFAQTLRQLGATTIELPFVHGAYDCVFAKDNAVLVDGRRGARALVARPRCPERQAEQRLRYQALESLGFATRTSERFFEGGDVVMLPRMAAAFVGYGFRSEPRATDALAVHLERAVIPLRLVDPRLYHLDMALAVLSDGTALICRRALEPGAIAALERAPGITRIVDIPLEEALQFGLNLVEVGRHVVLDSEAPTVLGALAALGKHIVRVDLSEFRLAGGSAACLTAAIHDDSAAATAPVLAGLVAA